MYFHKLNNIELDLATEIHDRLLLHSVNTRASNCDPLAEYSDSLVKHHRFDHIDS